MVSSRVDAETLCSGFVSSYLRSETDKELDQYEARMTRLTRLQE